MSESCGGPVLDQELSKLQALLERQGEPNDDVENSPSLAEVRDYSLSLASAYPNNPRVACAVGIIAYEAFMSGIADASDVERPLLQCLECQPGNQLAIIHLAYLYYDVREYEKCYFQLTKLDRNYFVSINQLWRVIKADELLLCCRIRKEDPTLATGDFRDFFSELAQTPMEDVPALTELEDTVLETAESPVWKNIDTNFVKYKLGTF